MAVQQETMESDIVGRIARFPLPPSEHNSLIPLFEAIHNAMHAINDRFGDETAKNGKISIQIFRDNDNFIDGFSIKDNGVGLDEENYRAFKTPDSRRKIKKGGKGVGRLGWLKVFKDIKIRSAYKSNIAFYNRIFDFTLDEKAQIQNIKHEKASADYVDIGTEIILKSFMSEYKAKCPKESESIANKIIAHFLPIFASNSAPKVFLVDEDYNENLSVLFQNQIEEDKTESLTVTLNKDSVDPLNPPRDIQLKIKHLKCKKEIAPKNAAGRTKGYNWLYYCAHERCVKDKKLDDALGLKALDGQFIYLGCASGDYLNQHVNQERTAFSLSDDEFDQINSEILKTSKKYLSDYIAEVREHQREVALNVIETNPQFLFIKDDLEDFLENKIKNSANPEEIKLEMFRVRMRRNNKFKRVKSDITNSEEYTKEVEENVEKYKDFLEEEQKGALAEYVLKRKYVLELLDKLRGYDPETDDEKHYLESAVHSLMCPMKADSTDLHFEDHNLWIVDDRLAFFDYFQSDKRFADFTSDGSGDRPDMTFFYQSCFAWRRKELANDTIVIVEFKRPGRDDYNKKSEDPPLHQLMKYIEKFKSGTKIKDKDGKVISSVSDGTAFHGYIIADITPTLEDSLKGMNFRATPDNAGMIAYIQNPDAFVEIISYEKLLNDAKLRNAIFFEKLGVSD